MPCKLPDEILLMIHDHLVWPRQPNLLLVSRHFYQVFLPALYCSVNLEWGDITRNIIPFVRTALRNPEIPRSIRHLHLPQVDTWNDRDVPIQDISTVNHLVHETSHTSEEQQKWESDLQRGSIDAWVTLLFFKLENLHSLSVGLLNEPEHLPRILGRAARAEKPFDLFPILKHLESLSIGSRDINYPFQPREALPFFRLPSLRSFSAIEALETFGSSEESEDNLSGLSAVTHIKMTQSNGKLGMRALITTCAKLESFEYQHQDIFAKGEYAEDFVPSAFHRPLLMQKESLKTLRFNDQHRDPPFELMSQDGGHNEGFGSLVEFTALTELWIRLPNLVGRNWETELVDLLPHSLEKLYLAHCWDRKLDQLVPQLQRMVTVRAQKFPSLREICVQPYCLTLMSREEFQAVCTPRSQAEKPKMKEQDLRKFDGLRDDCQQAGIGFAIGHPQFLSTMRDFVRGV